MNKIITAIAAALFAFSISAFAADAVAPASTINATAPAKVATANAHHKAKAHHLKKAHKAMKKTDAAKADAVMQDAAK